MSLGIYLPRGSPSASPLNSAFDQDEPRRRYSKLARSPTSNNFRIDTSPILQRGYGRQNSRWPMGRKPYCSNCTALYLEIEKIEKGYHQLRTTVSDQLRDKEIEVMYRSEAILNGQGREIYRLKEKLSATEEELETIKERKIEAYDDRVFRLQQRYHASLRDNRELERQIQKKEDYLWNLRWEVRDLESENKSLEEILEKKEADIQKLNYNLHQTEQKNVLCRIEIKKREDECDNMYASLCLLTMENTDQRKKIYDMERSITFDDKKEMKKLQNDFHETITELQKENHTLVAENDTLEENIRNLRLKYIQTENIFNSEMKNLRNENSELKNRIKEAEDKESRLLKPTPVAATSDNLLQELTALRKKNKELEEELKRRLQEKNDKALMHESAIRQKDEEILKGKLSLENKDLELKSLQSKLTDSEKAERFMLSKPSEYQRLHEEIEKLKLENSSLKKTLEDYLKRLTDSEKAERFMLSKPSEYQRLYEEIEKLKLENSSLKKTLERSAHEEGIRNKQLEEKLRNVSTENQTFRQRISTLQIEKDNAKARFETTLNELKSLQVEIGQRQRSQELEKRLAKEERETEKLKKELLEGRTALKRKDEVERENQHLKDNLNQFQVENKNLQVQNTQLNKTIAENKQQILDMDTETRRLKEGITQLTTEVGQLQRDFAEVSREKDNALTRLSKVAGAKLTQGNAAITDLSDTNRPTKLAEKFSELYDNQWTDAFEELDNTFNNEEETIQVLLKILQDAYAFCDRTETNYETRIGQAVFTLADEKTGETRQITGADVAVQKTLTELRLSLGNACCSVIEEMFLTRLPSILKKVDVTVSTKTKLYARHCASLCWRMRIRDPPVFVRFEFRRGTEFKTDILRRYTKTGGYLDFVVWPALYLHENGPVLAKGVAQPKLSP